MRQSRFKEEQIIGILREHEAGVKTADLCRKHGISSGANAQTMLHVSPNTVLISAGVDSQYGHPHADAVSAYARVAKHVFSTNVEGGVSLRTKRLGDDFETLLFR
jgi:beta-lactamase superfamily II metal-dependent hydrolase